MKVIFVEGCEKDHLQRCHSFSGRPGEAVVHLPLTVDHGVGGRGDQAGVGQDDVGLYVCETNSTDNKLILGKGGGLSKNSIFVNKFFKLKKNVVGITDVASD